MKFLDKLKDLFIDEEEVIETQEIDIEEPEEERKLPTFMRNKLEEEQKKEEKAKEIELNQAPNIITNREVVRTRSENTFSFPMDIEEPEIKRVPQTPIRERREEVPRQAYSNQNILQREKKPTELYSKKEDPKPKKFKPTPVISPVYGVLDKNYTNDDVKVTDEKTYELQRPSRKVDFETVRNKAFGSLTDDIRNNLCENCELYQEVKITKAADIKLRTPKEDKELLSEMKEDISIGDAEENYFDFGVDYEIPTREIKEEPQTVSITRTKVEEEIKIVNHNDEESSAEKIEVKEVIKENKMDDTKEFEKISTDEMTADLILESLTDITDIENDPENDIFNLIDSMYDEEDK